MSAPSRLERMPTRNPLPSTRDQILEDLRAFGRDLGIAGAAAMERDEIVESLRQRYVLEALLTEPVNPGRK